MSAVVIRYDSPLPSCANLREHWRKKASRAKAQRQQAKVMMMQHGMWMPKSLAPIVVTLTRISARDLDDDNLAYAFKATRDGVADALGIKDNDPRVTWVCRQRRGEKGVRAIEIRIEAKKAREA